MAAWFRKDKPREATRESILDSTDEDGPTGRLDGTDLARIVREVEGETEGTGPEAPASKPGVEPAPVTTPAGDGALEQALSDRRALIQLCLYAIDRARSGGVAERLEQGLAAIGVTALRPEGQRFDPALHEAGGAVPTEDATLEGTVAETEVVGFADRNQLLRAPVVTVYTRR
ncbi:nucleotide exchange factor GrpE [Amycolatopsis cihanbeyliensis]|uniref:GrpE protein n=1 Tax=Amycolatopsis cihanbeyliensis TaxID=1128664 RepID=A0A542DL00_AMYCI|nr:nucleotide exchange factor GrpE [Amycolatopsis cihanbeyliensis]TQJ03769.1 GrpE protein [Amycolatopsis cihanbeyliensis]